MARSGAKYKLPKLANLSGVKSYTWQTIADPTIKLNLVLFFPKQYFIIFISKQEQQKHNLHAILVKLHIKNILNRATVKKLLQLQLQWQAVVITSQTACKQSQTWQQATFQ